jgi:hypothetical protein
MHNTGCDDVLAAYESKIRKVNKRADSIESRISALEAEMASIETDMAYAVAYMDYLACYIDWLTTVVQNIYNTCCPSATIPAYTCVEPEPPQ